MGRRIHPRTKTITLNRTDIELTNNIPVYLIPVYNMIIESISLSSGYYATDNDIIEHLHVRHGKHPKEAKQLLLKLKHAFDKDLFKKGIVTSVNVQKKYAVNTRSRKSREIIKEYALIDFSKYKNVVFVDTHKKLFSTDYILRTCKEYTNLKMRTGKVKSYWGYVVRLKNLCKQNSELINSLRLAIKYSNKKRNQPKQIVEEHVESPIMERAHSLMKSIRESNISISPPWELLQRVVDIITSNPSLSDLEISKKLAMA